MFEKNMNGFDRTVRIVLGVALMPIGLFLLDGFQANPVGILVAAFGLAPLAAGVTGVCPLYIPFGISTLSEEQTLTKRS